MSVNNSHPELLYLLYTQLYPDKIYEALQVKLHKIFLEKKYEERKVDISAFDKNGRKCLIEIQLNKSNKTHLKQIETLIVNAAKGGTLLVWIAKEFRISDLLEIKKQILATDSNIEFIAYTLNEDVINMVQEINKEDIFKQVESLERLKSIESHFSFVERIRSYTSSDIISAELIDNNIIYTYKQQVLIRTIKELRKDFVDYPNVYQYKNVQKGYFGIGPGFEDIDIRVVYNKKGLYGVEVIFAQFKTKEIFKRLYKRREEISEKLDFLITSWDTGFHKIATYVNPHNYRDINNTVKLMARIVKRYVHVFNEYIREDLIENEER
ncbi:hypothetical protein [Clostridium tagluense]|uniref:hypothetical protein n=1 Tax=Clostridium tagluense TaxID=360422 RepID=UPI001CF489D2|nr:hypothetical protein [Clostridium tagluense]MCB2299866.1 hypothetical protein [Clostridium tagluense]